MEQEKYDHKDGEPHDGAVCAENQCKGDSTQPQSTKDEMHASSEADVSTEKDLPRDKEEHVPCFTLNDIKIDSETCRIISAIRKAGHDQQLVVLIPVIGLITPFFDSALDSPNALNHLLSASQMLKLSCPRETAVHNQFMKYVANIIDQLYQIILKFINDSNRTIATEVALLGARESLRLIAIEQVFSEIKNRVIALEMEKFNEQPFL